MSLVRNLLPKFNIETMLKLSKRFQTSDINEKWTNVLIVINCYACKIFHSIYYLTGLTRMVVLSIFSIGLIPCNVELGIIRGYNVAPILR